MKCSSGPFGPEDELCVKFDLRMCRRTFGQGYLDNNVDIESMSVPMGHANNKAMDVARNSWLSGDGQ